MTRSIFLFFPLFVFAQQEFLNPIRILQDKRIEQSTELFSLLKSTNERDRELALLAIANIQDTSAVDAVAPLLNDGSPKVRQMASFALGMIGKPRGAVLLFRRLSVERDEKCVSEIFNAIGLCGTQDDLKKMISQTENYRAQWKPYIAQAIYRFANRRIKDASATKYVATLLGEKSSASNATYALMRFNDTLSIKNNRTQLLAQLRNPTPEIRMWAATMLGALNDNSMLKYLIAVAKRDKDWRVRVNAIRSLRTKPAAKNEIMNLVADKNAHIALAAVSSYESIIDKEIKFNDTVKIISMLKSDLYSNEVKEELKRVLAKKIGEKAIPYIENWKTGQIHISAQRVRAYGETRSAKAIPVIKEAFQQGNHSLIIIAGLEAYQKVSGQMDDNVKKDFLKTAVLQFEKNDAGISYSAAIAFQDTVFSKSIRKIYLSALYSAYNKMKSESDLEPMVELLNVFAEIADSNALPIIRKGLSEQDRVIRNAAEKAYSSIAGEDSPQLYQPQENAYKPFYRTEDLKLLSKYNGAEISTSKGKIRITFEKESAPFTVLNFILLSQKKFYDGLSFHRVVSNFVIQGGDPIGNGSGGPNYAIRTEVHPNAKYKIGAVGMASAGKDTEGSQWFITHCPTPHLDYRYTIFAYTSDRKVVDTILVGDRIEKVVLF